MYEYFQNIFICTFNSNEHLRTVKGFSVSCRPNGEMTETDALLNYKKKEFFINFNLKSTCLDFSEKIKQDYVLLKVAKS